MTAARRSSDERKQDDEDGESDDDKFHLGDGAKSASVESGMQAMAKRGG